MPLVRKSALGAMSDQRFLEIVSVPNEKLGEFVKSIAKDSSRITHALDVLLSRAWG